MRSPGLSIAASATALRHFGLAVLLLALGGTAAWGASFQVSPTRFEFSLQRRFTNFFTVTNNSDQSLRVRVYPKFVALDEQNHTRVVASDPYDLAPWVVINPRIVSLSPAQKRIVRFSVRPPASLKPGEYRTVIFFEELPPPPQPARGQGQDTGGATFRIRLLTRLGITIYGMSGEKHPALGLESEDVKLDASRVTLQGVLVNDGNAHLQLRLEARIEPLAAAGPGAPRAPAGTVPSAQAEQAPSAAAATPAKPAALATKTERLTLQRGQRSRFTLTFDRPTPGGYRLLLTAREADTTLLERSYPLTVASPAGN